MYTIRTITLKNGDIVKKQPVIDFEDPNKAIIAEFLMSDSSLFAGQMNESIEQIKQGEKNSAQWTGNRCSLTIRGNLAIIEDLLEGLYEDTATYPPCEMKADKLQELVNMWLDVKRAYRK